MKKYKEHVLPFFGDVIFFGVHRQLCLTLKIFNVIELITFIIV